jgi:signal transduction histidine kinase
VKRWTDEFSRTVSSGEHFRGDYRFLARDDRIVWIRGEAKVMHDESGRPFLHGIGYDITELKRIGEDMRIARDNEQRANRAKSEFLLRTSHELRTPLHGIIGFAELLIERTAGALNPTQTDYLTDIYNCGLHLLSTSKSSSRFSIIFFQTPSSLPGIAASLISASNPRTRTTSSLME